MPIYCTALKPRQLRTGRRLGLRFLEPRYWEVVKRAMAPGGTRRFAAVTRGCAGSHGEEITVGAKGCLCEILESTEGEDGIWSVIVETAATCKVVSVQKEDMHRGPPLFIGTLEEVEEEEAGEDGSEDGNDSEAIVLGEEGQLELLRERVQLLELLNAAMELEQARLEQRRLELTMLLSQRRLYQELIEMQSEVADLVGLNISPNTGVLHSRAALHLRSPEGTGGASSSSEQWRQSQESRVPLPSRPYRLPPASSRSVDNRARSGEAEFHSLLSLTRRSFESVTSSVANALGTTMTSSSRGMSRAGEPPEAQACNRRSSRGSGAAHSQRGLTTSEAIRRRGGTAPGSRTAHSSSPSSSAASSVSLRGLQFRGSRGPAA